MGNEVDPEIVAQEWRYECVCIQSPLSKIYFSNYENYTRLMMLTAFQDPIVQCDSAKGETIFFWTGLLTGNVINWNGLEAVRSLIRLVITLPVGSSEGLFFAVLQ